MITCLKRGHYGNHKKRLSLLERPRTGLCADRTVLQEQAAEYGRAKRKAQHKVAAIEKCLRFALTLVLLGLVALFAGCHTVHGVGADLTSVSEPYINK